MQERHGIQVVLRDRTGRYLTGQKDAWSFTDDVAEARVFDYLADHIADQVGCLTRDHGIVLDVVAFDTIERYEICDRCGHLAMPYATFFDGKNYYCADCSKHQPREAGG